MTGTESRCDRHETHQGRAGLHGRTTGASRIRTASHSYNLGMNLCKHSPSGAPLTRFCAARPIHLGRMVPISKQDIQIIR